MKQPPREGLIAVRELHAPVADLPSAGAAWAADVVSPGKRVTLHFAVMLDDGAVVDSCFEREPAVCCIGDGSLLPEFEQTLVGLRAGETRDTTLPPERAFGQPNAANVQRFPRFRFPPDLQLAQGLVVDFADSKGYSQAGVVQSFDSQFVHIDFNHPLAGKTIVFRAMIVAVEAAAPQHASATQETP